MGLHKVIYKSLDWAQVNLFIFAVQMSLYGITADYNGPLKHANAHTDDDRDDMVELGAAGHVEWDIIWSSTKL